MSWLFKSLAFDSDSPSSSDHHDDDDETRGSSSTGGSLKEDLSVIGETVGRQLRGVAAFLAPPPSLSSGEGSTSSSRPALNGIRDDLAEIGGSFKSGLSLLSSNIAATGISKFASNLLQFQNEEDDDEIDDYGPGITDEVIDYVNDISMRPQWWTDFPLSLDDQKFKMSDFQKEHALTVEQLVPSIKSLRENLQTYMGNEQFWLIYFILLFPKLNEPDLELLSSLEIVETRNLLLVNLGNKRLEAGGSENSGNLTSGEESSSSGGLQDIRYQEKEVTEIINRAERIKIDDQNTEPKIEASDNAKKGIGYEDEDEDEDEDVSFSDLEDDENDAPTSSLALRPDSHDTTSSSSPCSRSSEWVELNEKSESSSGVQTQRQSISRGKDSEDDASDWLAVDDDFD